MLLWLAMTACAVLPRRTAGFVAVPRAAGLARGFGIMIGGAATSAELDFVNTAVGSLLGGLVKEHSDLGRDLKQKNARSGGSGTLVGVEATGADDDGLELQCVIKRRVGFGYEEAAEATKVRWCDVGADSLPNLEARLAKAADALGDAFAPDVMRLARMPGGSGAFEVPRNLRLNNVPAPRPVRDFFENAAIGAVFDALDRAEEEEEEAADEATGGVVDKLYVLNVRPPELNDEFDTYRAGSVLELVRSVALALVGQGLRVKVCVQGPLGEGFRAGMPLSLSGLARLLQMMDWGEGDPVASGAVRFGEVGADHVDDEDEVFILISPQSIVSHSIIPLLAAHVAAAKGRPIVLFNPRLGDIQSAENTMSVRGRADRLKFAADFREIFRFTLVVPPGKTFFPIVGALVRPRLGAPYALYERQSLDDEMPPGERYAEVAAFAAPPDEKRIMTAIRAHRRAAAAAS